MRCYENEPVRASSQLHTLFASHIKQHKTLVAGTLQYNCLNLLA